jgi:hypothetical protein
LFSWWKRKLKVDLGELEDERESLSSFLRTTLKVEVTSDDNNVLVDSEKLSPQELNRLVNKFIYHRNLNNKYWVALEGGVVKINKFKGVKKSEKRKKEATPPSTIKHGW